MRPAADSADALESSYSRRMHDHRFSIWESRLYGVSRGIGLLGWQGLPFGLLDESKLDEMEHMSRSPEWIKYASTAIHSASMDGNSSSSPQIWSSAILSTSQL